MQGKKHHPDPNFQHTMFLVFQLNVTYFVCSHLCIPCRSFHGPWHQPGDNVQSEWDYVQALRGQNSSAYKHSYLLTTNTRGSSSLDLAT